MGGIRMQIFYEPVNLNQWHMFNNVTKPDHVEHFLATTKMEYGDCMLLYVGTQDKDYAPGVYAIGIIVSEPFIVRGREDEYCNNKLSVNVKIVKLSRTPLMSKECFARYNNSYRRVHMLEEEYYKDLDRELGLTELRNKHLV